MMPQKKSKIYHVWSVETQPNILRLYVKSYVDMPDVTISYGIFFCIIGSFYGNFNVWYDIIDQTFINFVES